MPYGKAEAEKPITVTRVPPPPIPLAWIIAPFIIGLLMAAASEAR